MTSCDADCRPTKLTLRNLNFPPISGYCGGSIRKKHWSSFTGSSSGDPSRCVSRSSSNPESLSKDEARYVHFPRVIDVEEIFTD